MNNKALNLALNLALILALTAAAPARPQQPDDAPNRPENLVPTATSFADGFGLTVLGERLIGAGPGYEAWFDEDAITFTPALGADAPRTERLRLALEAVGRRDALARGFATDRVRPVGEHGGLTVRYPRPGYVETYEIRRDGIKQNFVFDALPPGGGDLVVRLRVDTDLPLAHAAHGELRFERAGLGGVRIGEVVGIDALDRRVQGSMRYRDGALELSLPARFVDAAALPLVLDPPVSPVHVGGGGDEYHPDVAFNAAADEYLVVFSRRFSAQDASIRCRRLTAAGVVKPYLFTVRSSVGTSARPRVANDDATNRFAVVWHERTGSNNNVMVSTVRAGTGSIYPAVPVANTPFSEAHPDVGGQTNANANWVTVVWVNETFRRLEGAQVIIHDNDGRPQVWSEGNLTSVALPGRPRISNIGGSLRRHLVVYAEGSQVRGILVDQIPRIIAGPAVISTSAVEPAVDGDGTHWVVAYTSTAGGQIDVACRAVHFAPPATSLIVGAETLIENGLNDEEREPAVAWLGESALVVFKDRDGGNFNLYSKTINPYDCTPCEPEQLVAGLSPDNEEMAAIASQLSGNGTQDEALIVWQASYGDRDVFALRFRAEDGEVLDAGQGCSTTAKARAGAAIAGNSNFAVKLFGAQPNRLAILMVSDRLGHTHTCNCVSLLGGLISTGGIVTTDANGQASVLQPLQAAMSGSTVCVQWRIVTPGQFCGNTLSNGLEIQIE